MLLGVIFVKLTELFFLSCILLTAINHEFAEEELEHEVCKHRDAENQKLGCSCDSCYIAEPGG